MTSTENVCYTLPAMKETIKPLVAVTWTDAYVTTSTQFEAHEIPHVAIVVKTYGLLLRDDEQGISIASESVAEGAGSYRGVTFIPRGMVIGVEHLSKARARTKKVRASICSADGDVPA